MAAAATLAVTMALTAVMTAALTSCGTGHSTPAKAATSLPQATSGPQGADAKEFVRRWLAAEQRMRTTGRTAPYLAANPDCADCATTAHYVRSWYAKGGYVRWNGYRIRSIRFTPSSGGGIVTVHAVSTPETIKTSRAGTPNHFGARKTTLYLRLAPKGRSYTVTTESEG